MSANDSEESICMFCVTCNKKSLFTKNAAVVLQCD